MIGEFKKELILLIIIICFNSCIDSNADIQYKYGLFLNPTYLPQLGKVIYTGYTAFAKPEEDYSDLFQYFWILDIKENKVELIKFTKEFHIPYYNHELSYKENEKQVIFSCINNKTGNYSFGVLFLRDLKCHFLSLPQKFGILCNPRFLANDCILFSGLEANEDYDSKFELNNYLNISNLIQYNLNENTTLLLADNVLDDGYEISKSQKVYYLKNKTPKIGTNFPQPYYLFYYDIPNKKTKKLAKLNLGFFSELHLSPDEKKLLIYYTNRSQSAEVFIYDLMKHSLDKRDFPNFEYLRWGLTSDSLIGVKVKDNYRRICLLNLIDNSIKELCDGTAPKMINDNELIYAYFNKEKEYPWEFFILNITTKEKKSISFDATPVLVHKKGTFLE